MGVSGLSARGFVSLTAALTALGCVDAEAAPHVIVSVEALRPDSPGTSELPPVFDPGDRVERLDSKDGTFRIHYARKGEHAVPAADADADGVPDYVQLVAAEYDAVGEFYANELGFARPAVDDAVRGDNGGDGRFDVYLLDFPTSADGAFVVEECAAPSARRCPGYMKHENDFAGRNYPTLARATRILASHEYFHAVQAGYDAKAGGVISEGTAVWASEAYDPTLTDLENFVSGYLDRPDRGLAQEVTGPVDSFSYGASLFFQFLSERYDRDVIRELWSAQRDSGAGTAWVRALDDVLRAEHESSLADAFADFTRWNLYTAGRADPGVAYARGEGYPELKAKAVTLPLEDTGTRIFPLAAKVYSARAAKSGALQLALRSEGSLEGVRLLLAREVGGRIREVKEARADDAAAVTLEQVDAGDEIIAAVINTRLSGESARPDVCLGGASDTKDCAQARGVSASDAGRDDADAEGEAHERSSGCTVSARLGMRRDAWWLIAVGAALGVAVRRRRERARVLAS